MYDAHERSVLVFPQELEQQFERERQSLEEQKTLLRQQLDELREELTSKLTAANKEVGSECVPDGKALELDTSKLQT